MKHPLALENFLQFYNNFKIDDPAFFNKVYDSSIVFKDPFHHVINQENVFKYFEKMMKAVTKCDFKIHEVLANLDKKTNTGSAMIIWDMNIVHKRLNSGKEFTVNGVSHIQFNEKVFFHRDYFDSSQLIYKNIPVLGKLIKILEKGI